MEQFFRLAFIILSLFLCNCVPSFIFYIYYCSNTWVLNVYVFIRILVQRAGGMEFCSHVGICHVDNKKSIHLSEQFLGNKKKSKDKR